MLFINSVEVLEPRCGENYSLPNSSPFSSYYGWRYAARVQSTWYETRVRGTTTRWYYFEATQIIGWGVGTVINIQGIVKMVIHIQVSEPSAWQDWVLKN